jgi:hypothetical protein
MTAHQNGPPGPRDGESRATASPTPAQQIDDTTAAANDNRSASKRTFTTPSTPKSLPRICATDVAGQLRARRGASQRMVSLDCGCRDPWPCRCSDPPLSENMIDAGRSAALHILDTGKVPLLELEVLRALYRRGGADRTLAERLHQMTGGVVR